MNQSITAARPAAKQTAITFMALLGMTRTRVWSAIFRLSPCVYILYYTLAGYKAAK